MEENKDLTKVGLGIIIGLFVASLVELALIHSKVNALYEDMFEEDEEEE